MHDEIIVSYKGASLVVYKVVADRLNLSRGQWLKTEKEFCMVLGENATHIMLVAQAKQRPLN